MALVMYTTTGPVVCCDASHVGSLDTLHATDGLVDTIPDTSRCMYYRILCYPTPLVVGIHDTSGGTYLVLDHWIHYTLQMVCGYHTGYL